MTNPLQQGESRSRTILRHTRQAIDDGALRVLPFSEAVSDRYLAETQPEDRVVNLREQGQTMDSALKAKSHNGQVIDRLIRGTVKSFPADLEDAWVAMLPQQYRQRCEQDLSARRGFMPVRDPRAATSPTQQGGELSDLLREVGEACAALAPIFADGKVDEADLPYIRQALPQLGDVLTAALQVHHRLADVVLSAATAPSNVAPLRRA